MYARAVADDADIVVCNFVHEYATRRVLCDYSRLTGNAHELLKTWYSNTTHMSCWNKLIRRSVYYNNNVLPWVGLNMWEDNGLVTRLFYYSCRISHVAGPLYHYNRQNVHAMTSGYGDKQVRQMIEVARNLTEFFDEKPDSKEYKKTALAFQFLARLNLVTDTFRGLRAYRVTFPESSKIIPELDRNAFSQKGKVRFYFVRFHLSWLFVLLFKAKNLVDGLRRSGFSRCCS